MNLLVGVPIVITAGQLIRADDIRFLTLVSYVVFTALSPLFVPLRFVAVIFPESSIVAREFCISFPEVLSKRVIALSVALAGHSTLAVFRFEKFVFITDLLSVKVSVQSIVVIVVIIL